MYTIMDIFEAPLSVTKLYKVETYSSVFIFFLLFKCVDEWMCVWMVNYQESPENSVATFDGEFAFIL